MLHKLTTMLRTPYVSLVSQYYFYVFVKNTIYVNTLVSQMIVSGSVRNLREEHCMIFLCYNNCPTRNKIEEKYLIFSTQGSYIQMMTDKPVKPWIELLSFPNA